LIDDPRKEHAPACHCSSAEKLNYEGMRDIARLVALIAREAVAEDGVDTGCLLPDRNLKQEKFLAHMAFIEELWQS
jgi:hypothetical protein